ncbi:MAG: lysophospholipid acyltransferase family protein [Bacteroidota bacterium]
MKFILNILHSIYGLYAVLCFFIFMPLILLIYVFLLFLPEQKRMMSIFYINRVWFKLWSVLTGIWMKIEGHDFIERNESYVILLTHNNLLDIPAAASCILHPFKPLVKKELMKIPLMGQLLSLTSIPVSRKSKESRKASFERMVSHINRGISVLIFPEGTRNRSEKPLKDFYDGGFKLAIRTQKPILPVVILGHRELQPVDTFRAKPGTLTFKIMEPINTVGMAAGDAETLKEKVHQLMLKTLLEEDPYTMAKEKDKEKVKS